MQSARDRVASAQEPVLLRDPEDQGSLCLGADRDLRRPGRHRAAARRCASAADRGLPAADGELLSGDRRHPGAAARSLPAHRHRLVRPPPVRLRRQPDARSDRERHRPRHSDPRRAAAILQADRSELARLMLGVAMYASEEVPMKLQTRDTPDRDARAYPRRSGSTPPATRSPRGSRSTARRTCPFASSSGRAIARSSRPHSPTAAPPAA